MDKKSDKDKLVPLWELLVGLGMAGNKKQAQGFVMAGEVVVDDQRIDKPSALVARNAQVRLKGKPQFVSRAGEKLFQWAKANKQLELFSDASVLDIGSSTGGFTDVALRHGANFVCCVDVGTNQLVWNLRSDPRVQVFEKTDIQVFDPQEYKFDLVLMDISFQSVARVLPKLPWKSFEDCCQFVFLVKPQFELSSVNIPAGGVVLDPNLHSEAVGLVKQKAGELSLDVIHMTPSPILGRTGNQEFFLHARLAK